MSNLDAFSLCYHNSMLIIMSVITTRGGFRLVLRGGPHPLSPSETALDYNIGFIRVSDWRQIIVQFTNQNTLRYGFIKPMLKSLASYNSFYY